MTLAARRAERPLADVVSHAASILINVTLAVESRWPKRRAEPHSAGSAIMALLLTAAGAPAAEPGEQQYTGHQHDPADPEHPEDGGVVAGEGVDQ